MAIVLKDELLTTLPAAIILQSPEQLKGRLLPHINMGWYLCYVEEKEATWDPNDLEGLLRSVDIQIGLTLNNSVNAVETGLAVDAEMEGEFSSYWLARHTAYLVADVTQQKEFNCFVAGKRAARTVLTGMCYSVGSATRQGSSSLTRFIGQSAMTSRT